MVQYRGKVKPTKAELQHMERIRQLPCCVCLPDEQHTPTQCHHITQGSRRVGHFYCLPLCEEHHENVHLLGLPLVKRLWGLVNETLGIQRAWKESKVLPRR